jgi:hypothetical protein
MTLAASDGVHDVYVEIETQKNGHWGWASNDPARAGRLLDARAALRRGRRGEKGRAAMLAKYGPYSHDRPPGTRLQSARAGQAGALAVPERAPVADGHLAIPGDDLPMVDGGTPFDVDRSPSGPASASCRPR